MSADLIAYGDCVWEPQITVVNPDGSRERKTLKFEPQEGAKIYIDKHLYADTDDGVSETYTLNKYLDQERLEALWDDD